MRRIFGARRSSAASQQYQSSAGFIINTSGFRFGLGTGIAYLTIQIDSLQNALIFLCPRAEERHSLRELRAHWCQSVVDVWRQPRKLVAAAAFAIPFAGMVPWNTIQGASNPASNEKLSP
jgi:hypothetical protein